MPSEFIMNKANRVLDHISPSQDGRKEIDVLMIASLIIGLIKIFQECRKDPAKGARQAQDPGLFQRMRLRKYVREKLGRDMYYRKGEEVISGILKLGQDATANDIQQLIKEAEL